MAKSYPGEQWKRVKFDVKSTTAQHIEISNYGRLRTFNYVSDGNIINGSMVNGYRIVRLKLYKPRDKKTQQRFDEQQQNVFRLMRKIKAMQANKAGKKAIAEATASLNVIKIKLSKKFKDDLWERTIYYHSLIHRLVADYFLRKPTSNQTIVGHLDFDRLNNKASNLKWMTPDENYEHQKSSPHVIKERIERRKRLRNPSATNKLTIDTVKQLKKQLKQGTPMKELIKTFKVTGTQINRIKKGENWADVKAAK